MQKDERTVIERLDDIENKIPSFEYKEPKTLSEIIGRPFENYLKEATVYGYEEDTRKFEKEIKRKRTIPIILLSLIIPILVFDFVSLIVNKQLEWLLVLSSAFAIICPLLGLIALSKQKNKQPMSSFWNYNKTDFYVANKGSYKSVASEGGHGKYFYLLLVFKTVSIIVSFVGVFWYFIASMERTINNILFWIGSALGYLVIMFSVLSIAIGKQYYYYHYIFETNDSYVMYPSLEYFKK